MTYEDEVIDAARKGYGQSMTKWTPELEKLLRLVYSAGYQQAQREIQIYSVFND